MLTSKNALFLNTVIFCSQLLITPTDWYIYNIHCRRRAGFEGNLLKDLPAHLSFSFSGSIVLYFYEWRFFRKRVIFLWARILYVVADTNSSVWRRFDGVRCSHGRVAFDDPGPGQSSGTARRNRIKIMLWKQIIFNLNTHHIVCTVSAKFSIKLLKCN